MLRLTRWIKKFWNLSDKFNFEQADLAVGLQLSHQTATTTAYSNCCKKLRKSQNILNEMIGSQLLDYILQNAYCTKKDGFREYEWSKESKAK